MNLNGDTYSYTNANSNTLKFLELNDVDMWMTEFMVTSNQLYLKNKLKSGEVKHIEKLIDTYRIYLGKDITNSSILNMRYNISDFIQGTKPISSSKILRTEPRGVTVKFGMVRQEFKQDEKEDEKDEKFDDSRLFSRGIPDLTENEKNERFRIEAERNMSNMFMHIAEKLEQKDSGEMNTNILMTKVLNTVNEIKEEQMESKMDRDTLMNTSFSLWPSKIKKMVASGFKNTLRTVSTFPITTPFKIIHKYTSLAVGGIKMVTSPFYKLLQIYCAITLVGNVLYVSFKPDLISIPPEFTKSLEVFRDGIADMGKPYALLSEVENHIEKIGRDFVQTGNWNTLNDERYLSPNSISNVNTKMMLTLIKKTVQITATPTLIAFNTVTDYEKPLEGYYQFLSSAVQSSFVANNINLAIYYKERIRYDFCSMTYWGYVGCGKDPEKPLPIHDQLKLSIEHEKQKIKEHRIKQENYNNCMLFNCVDPGEYDLTNLEKLEKLASNPTLYGKISKWISWARNYWDSIDDYPEQVPEEIPKI